MYELHADGSGVAFSSRRRPIVNMRPRHRFSFLGTWQFPSDLYLVDWLEHRGYDYDVLTDEDLHRDGVQRAASISRGDDRNPSRVRQRAMLNAYEQYAAGAGHVMYMGGNGFYWVISYSVEKPWIMEVRRGENGVRAWQAWPGRNLAQHHRREGRHLAQPGPRAAEAVRYRLRLRGLRRLVSLSPDARRRASRGARGSSPGFDPRSESATTAWSAAARRARRSTAPR